MPATRVCLPRHLGAGCIILRAASRRWQLVSNSRLLPWSVFPAGTLLGCLPNNFVAVNAGSRLGELQSLRDLYDPKMLGIGELWVG